MVTPAALAASMMKDPFGTSTIFPSTVSLTILYSLSSVHLVVSDRRVFPLKQRNHAPVVSLVLLQLVHYIVQLQCFGPRHFHILAVFLQHRGQRLVVVTQFHAQSAFQAQRSAFAGRFGGHA